MEVRNKIWEEFKQAKANGNSRGQQILAGSVMGVTTTGLDDDNIDKGETPGDSWGDAMSRRSVWDE